MKYGPLHALVAALVAVAVAQPQHELRRVAVLGLLEGVGRRREEEEILRRELDTGPGQLLARVRAERQRLGPDEPLERLAPRRRGAQAMPDGELDDTVRRMEAAMAAAKGEVLEEKEEEEVKTDRTGRVISDDGW